MGDHRAKGAAGHDNRTFGSEWSTGADGDCGRQRLEERNLWLHAAAIDQNGLDGFWYSVASNALRTVSRHDPDDQCTGDGDENAVDAQVVADRRNHRGTPSAEVKQIREQPDQAQQHQGDERAERADSHRQCGDRKSPRSCREISQLFVTVAVPGVSVVARQIYPAAVTHLSFSPSWTNSLRVSRAVSRRFPAKR